MKDYLLRVIRAVDAFSPSIRDFFGDVFFGDFFSFLSFLGTFWFSFPVYLLLWFVGGYYKAVAVSIALGEISNHTIMVPVRYRTKRARPTPFPESQIFLDTWNRYSFPSAHAARSAMIATVLLLSSQLPTLLVFLLPISMGTTRLYLKKHYISDIVAGFFLGAASGLLAVVLVGKL